MNTEQNTKVEAQVPEDGKVGDTNLKKKASYTYWTRNIPSDNEVSAQIQPTKLEDGKKPDIQDNNKSVGSAWNTAGTWEEKHFTKQQVKEFFEKFLPLEFQGFSLTKVNSVSGDTFLVFSRGKIKICYDNEMSFDVKGKGDYGDCSGSVKITDITNSEGESMEWDLSKLSGSNSNKFKDAIRSEQKEVEARIRAVYNKMKE